MLSKHTIYRLVLALKSKKLAEEFESKLFSPAPLSSKLKNAILYMMANKKAAEELIYALENAGSQSLTKYVHPNARRRLELALNSRKALQEIEPLL